MITIKEVVVEILSEDETALQTLARGIMNYSSYARQILKDVEKMALKPIQEKSVVVTLTRLQKELAISASIQSSVKIISLVVHSDLEEVTYPKLQSNLQTIKSLGEIVPANLETFFTAIQGMTEITVIAESQIVQSIKELFSDQVPSYFIKGLTGVTAKFSVSYLNVPNVLHNIGKKLASKNINVVEVVSTTTEITYIIEKKDTELAVAQLSKLL